MKSKSIDLNQFMLHHVEKVILVAGIGLLGLFCWLGYSTPVFNTKTPAQLAQDAKVASDYITNNEAWNKIAEFRKGDSNANERINKAEASLVDLEKRKYVQGPLLGTKAKSLGLRYDPDLLAPVELVAGFIRSPLLIRRLKDDKRIYPISKLPLASASNEENSDDGNRPGSGGFGGDFAENQDDGKKEKNKKGLVIGDTVPEIQEQYMPGVRPILVSLKKESDRSRISGMVAIYGLVKFKNQWTKYDQVLKDATAYYPDRDRPKYSYVEVQRRENKDGKWTEWADISNANMSFVSSRFPNVSEVVAAENWDKVLTGRMPPISQVDYRQFASHPNGKVNLRDFGGIDLGYTEDVVDDSVYEDDEFRLSDADANSDANDETEDPASRGNTPNKNERTGNRKGTNIAAYLEVMKATEPSADYKLLRFFDLYVVEGNSYQYRVRLWLEDPNNESKDGTVVGATSDPGRSAPSAGLSGLEGGEATGGGGADGKKDYIYIALAQSMTHSSVRERLRTRSTDLPAKGLEYSRPTEWAYVAAMNHVFPEDGTQPTEAEAIPATKDTGRFFAGKVTTGKTFKTADGKGYVQVDDPYAEMVTSTWSTRFQTSMPGHKIIRRGDVLNFKPSHPIHMLHPIDWTVRKIEAKNNPVIKTDAVVVDIIGGQKLTVSGALLDYFLPGEVLIMDNQGDFHVQNNDLDRRDYRQSLFLQDAIAEVGKVRKKDEDEGGGDFPGD